jgi:hypothetical protein
MESWHYVHQKKILYILLLGEISECHFLSYKHEKKKQDLSPLGENGGGRGEISWRLSQGFIGH